MRRQELIVAVEKLKHAIISTSIPEALAQLSRNNGKPDAGIIKSFQAWGIYVHNATTAERTVLHILGLDELAEPEFWQELFTGEPHKRVSQLRSPLRMLQFVMLYLGKLTDLIKPDAIKSLEQRSNKSDEILSVIVIENENQHSKPERLSEALMSISLLYGVVADLEGINQNTLSVITCDSGSDKSFDFLGAAKAVAG